jgi:tRNA-modifying protein YgfZ
MLGMIMQHMTELATPAPSTITSSHACASAAQLPSGICRLQHLGVIAALGPEAASFLQGQLTHDFSMLGLSQARLAGFCSAKGRMQASFIAFKRSHEEIWLVCSRDLLAQTLKRLTMFVLRSKVKLSDISASTALYGATGNAIQNIANNVLNAPATAQFGSKTWVSLPPAQGTQRALVAQPADDAAPEGATLSEALWLWGEVMSGVATVSLPVFEAFVPQMINYESVGGVSFKKGCYPGQEVVARSQFRGAIKRRGYLAHCLAPLAAGQEVFAASDAVQPAGIVAQAARAPDGAYNAIVSLQTAAAHEPLTVNGQALTLLPLPYPLLEDI